mmetsp:Transcript_31876/g.38009  ORF Transcript_31876/g.38009 Transcript_31876/m.38009 type:complete len:86 (-) Transcript_31876:720-977(-)
MHTNNLIINDRTTGQTIKGTAVTLPEFDGIPTAAFIVESVYAVDGGAFVVSAEDEEIFGVFDLVGEEEGDYFEGLFAAVYVVAEE